MVCQENNICSLICPERAALMVSDVQMVAELENAELIKIIEMLDPLIKEARSHLRSRVVKNDGNPIETSNGVVSLKESKMYKISFLDLARCLSSITNIVDEKIKTKVSVGAIITELSGYRWAEPVIEELKNSSKEYVVKTLTITQPTT